MSTPIFAQVPDANVSSTVTADKLALVGMNDNIVDRNSMRIVALNTAGASVPNLNGAVFGASDHPFPLAVKSYASNVTGMTFESKDRVRIGRLDIVEFDIVSSGGR